MSLDMPFAGRPCSSCTEPLGLHFTGWAPVVSPGQDEEPAVHAMFPQSLVRIAVPLASRPRVEFDSRARVNQSQSLEGSSCARIRSHQNREPVEDQLPHCIADTVVSSS